MVGSPSENFTAAAYYRPTPAQVVTAAASLYADGLKPFGRILLKRVGELAVAECSLKGTPGYSYVSTSEGFIPRMDPKHLLRICRQCPQLRVEHVDSTEYAATLVGWPPTFIDSSCTDDPYPPDLWADLRAYFDGPAENDPPLPGGRYNCAKLLKARNLPFLQDLSLGEVCHVLALAVSQKKILGHFKGHTVPYARSENGRKEFCASAELPIDCAKLASSGFAVATWEQVFQGLRELLADSVDKGASGIPMPNVKRLFRSRLGLELSETALGHSRVQDLLQDERLHGICEVGRQGANSSYVVVPQCGTLRPCAATMRSAARRRVESAYRHPPPALDHSWLERESGQPAWISPTLLESIRPLELKPSCVQAATPRACLHCWLETDGAPCHWCQEAQPLLGLDYHRRPVEKPPGLEHHGVLDLSDARVA